MDREAVAVRLTAIFREVFNDSGLVLTDGLTARDVDAWDSLTHVDLIVAVEQEFKIRLSTAQVRALRNVGSFIDLITEKVQ